MRLTERGAPGFYDTPRERVLTFTASASVLQVQLYFVQNVRGVVGSAGGVDTVLVDNVTLTRLN
jgi:hypothetical protein